MNIIYFIIIINNNFINMYKYNKNDNMTKEFVWFSGQCFLGHLKDFASNPGWLLFFRFTFYYDTRLYCKFFYVENIFFLFCTL